MHRSIKRILVLIAGWAFLVLGFAGLFLPFLQGILFLIVGLLILSTEYVWAHRLLTRLSERFPGIRKVADSFWARAKGWLRRGGHISKTD